MSLASPFPGLSGDGPNKLTTTTMASIRRRSEPFSHLSPTAEDITADQDATSDGAQSKATRGITSRLVRHDSTGRGDSLQPPEIPQISVRASTNTEQTFAQRLINASTGAGGTGSSSGSGRPDTPGPDLSARLPIDAARRKGVAFLSRLGMRGGRKKDDPDDHDDGASAISEYRSEADGRIIMPSCDAAGFIPRLKEAPRYLKIRSYSAKEADFEHLFLAQELSRAKPMDSTTPITTAGKRVVHSADSIWAAEFSKDGRYLAVAGQDQVVRVYALLSTPEERTRFEDEASEASEGGRAVSAPVFRAKPFREYTGHTGSIHDLAWSKNNFLLSSSSDKTVRLWYPSMPNHLHVFEHKDSVVSIAFHPTDDRFFLAGAQDSVLRLWSIPDKEVAFSTQEADIITAVAFAPDGKTCMAGLMNGDCIFYDTNGLKRQTEIQVRSTRGKNSKGSKITSIQAMAIPPDEPDAKVKVLISSNDSRIRIYNLGDKSLDAKLKGHENSCSHVKARFSNDGAYVITGSEDRRAFIWSTDASRTGSKDKGRHCESFVAHSGAVTAAVMAPRASRLLLSASCDPVYDLCNPPPVTLMSMAETTTAATATATATGAPFLPDEAPDTPTRIKKKKMTTTTTTTTTEESPPGYLVRSAHPNGNIIVTSDRTGQIRVFRQDCASAKRRSDVWEMHSSSRIGLSSRAASVRTKASAGSRAHSRRGSLAGGAAAGGILTPQQSNDRINLWRHNVEGDQVGRPRPISLPAPLVASPPRSSRSRSPSKPAAVRASANTSVVTLASEARRQPYAGLYSPVLGRFPPGSPTSSVHTSRTMGDKLNTNYSGSPSSSEITHGAGRDKDRDPAPSRPPTPSFTFRSIDSIDESEANAQTAPGNAPGSGGSGFSFWNSFSRLRSISALRISTAPLSAKSEGDGPPSNAESSSPGGTHDQAIGTSKVDASVIEPLVRVDYTGDEDGGGM